MSSLALLLSFLRLALRGSSCTRVVFDLNGRCLGGKLGIGVVIVLDVFVKLLSSFVNHIHFVVLSTAGTAGTDKVLFLDRDGQFGVLATRAEYIFVDKSVKRREMVSIDKVGTYLSSFTARS